jgi:membrane fusion protein (multidrug efflux system)
MAHETDRTGGAKPSRGLMGRPLLVVGIGLGLIVVAVAGLLWWLNARNFESTDDAFIDAHIVRLAPQIAGRVTVVEAADNQLVRAGQPVLSIDSADVATRVAQARAQRAQAQAQATNAADQIAVSQASYSQAEADLAAARAPADNAAADLARYLHLAAINRLAVSQQQIDQARSAARQTGAQRDSAAKAAQNRAAQVTAARSQAAAGQAQVNAAQAQLDENLVSLGYTQVVAPVAGHITQRTVAVGDYVQPGTQVMAIVPLEVWITANFKETQLAHIRPGQSVAIKVDACPEDHIPGHVDSIQRGAGQAFGILPPENATGNYVKVVQRVPVKIVFDRVPRDCPLGPGMSVTPTVRVR